ncbi:unnamed protein product [Candida verbasci]|uniref:Major facilitator superfamily (MFS) profile domain-containing protein n=1 Tax=Candida verbasci TaxID=1227364 RepID=A0A9W4XC59_9ASCO|nr:unnamed protein product [Candida verbasci]
MSWIKFLIDEIGLSSLYKSNKDVYFIILLRMIRLIGFGSTSLILVLYLKSLDIREELIGFFLTLTFIGDLVLSFVISLYTDLIGRKRILLSCSLLMGLTGLSFVIFDNFYILAAVAMLGILTPSGGEVGPFRTIEQSSIASLVTHEFRSDIYAWYLFLGSFCHALGSILAGCIIDSTLNAGFNKVESYKFVFLSYTILGGVSCILCMFLSNGIEIEQDKATVNETSQLLQEEGEIEPISSQKKKGFKFLPHLTPDIYSIVIKLSLLFGLDSFASSLTPISWQSYYINNKFNLSSSFLGSIFFTTGIIASFTALGSTSLNKRIGAVKTMVFTHLPASILLACVPLPKSLYVTLTILILRSSTSSMDTAPKHVFLATLIADNNRTAVFGFVNVVKTLSQAIGPTIVGILTKNNLQWVSFIIAGSLKSIYDIGILVTFITYNKHVVH